MAFRHAALALALTLTSLPASAADAALTAALAPAHRDAANVVRDKARHPEASLEFWGLKPGMTVIEIAPGGGYWSEILAPYAKASNGHYIAAMGGPGQKLPAKFNDPAFGTIGYTIFSNASGPMTGGADLILTARNIHDWMWTPGFSEKSMRDFFAALKPGGILAVEEHRADPRPMVKEARDGYVATQHIIDLATAAGFRLEARSEINANPKDTKDHPFGVWTLPPTRRSAQPPAPDNASFDHAKFDAIGESDRMTLRFRKPG